jgi:hypothetical protein
MNRLLKISVKLQTYWLKGEKGPALFVLFNGMRHPHYPDVFKIEL